MITYNELVTQPQRFLALTGLAPCEFGDLLPAFAKAHSKIYPRTRTLDGQPRQRWVPAGRHGTLGSMENKLLFSLVYLKTYPLQVVLGELFGISTSRANYWLQHLLPVLKQALDYLGVMPERRGKHLAAMTFPAPEQMVIIIDGTERRRQRPRNAEKQALHYSGKKKAHTDKNVLVVNASSDRVLFLSNTYAGKTNDKRIADQEHIVYPREVILYKDAGFQGYEPAVKQTCQAKKKAEGKSA